MGRVPDLLLPDPDEPLPVGEDLDRRLTAPAGSDALRQALLLFEDPIRFHIREDRLPALGGGKTGVLLADIRHLSGAVDGFPEREVVLFPPVDILLVPKRTDHDRTRPERRVDCLILNDRDGVAEKRHREGFSLRAGGIGRRPGGPRPRRRQRVTRQGGRNLHAVEIKEVELRFAVLVGDLGKRDSRLTPGAVVDRVFVLVDVAGFLHPQKRELGLLVIFRHHRDVLVRPVRGECHAPERQAHLLYILLRELPAHLPELLP